MADIAESAKREPKSPQFGLRPEAQGARQKGP